MYGQWINMHGLLEPKTHTNVYGSKHPFWAYFVPLFLIRFYTWISLDHSTFEPTLITMINVVQFMRYFFLHMAEGLYFLEEGGISLCMVTHLIQQTFESLCWPLILFDFQATNTLSKQTYILAVQKQFSHSRIEFECLNFWTLLLKALCQTVTQASHLLLSIHLQCLLWCKALSKIS